jgi:hypothetical protein
MFFFQDACQVASSVKAKCTYADNVRMCLRHTPLMLRLRQSRHVSNVMSVESSPNGVVIHTHNEVIVVFAILIAGVVGAVLCALSLS